MIAASFRSIVLAVTLGFGTQQLWRQQFVQATRRCDRTSGCDVASALAYGPTIGKNIALAYLPWAYCQEGRKLNVEYFGETYPVEVVGIGCKPLYDPESKKPRT